jgi:photosystem II stability/assembly factor-like uncharacterized protein
MMVKRCVAALAAVAGCVLGVAAPAVAAVPSPGAGRAIPRGLLPVATSWPTPLRGIVLGYPSRTVGARPSLIVTGDGGRTWRPLPAPPVRYPADNDQPDATWAGGIIAVTDGTRIVATRDAGRHWSVERLAGASGAFYVDHLAIASSRVFALVTTVGNTMAAVYSGPARAGVLRPVPGLSITGSPSYGDITTAGALQVDLGANFAAERYWYSRDGVHFIAAPLPCPAATMALLGGVHAGRVSALCNGRPSDVAPGINDKQAWAAAQLGGTFRPSGPVFVTPDQEQFAAASAHAMTVATIFTLAVTVNTGRTWAAALTRGNGAVWSDLSFPSATTGIVVCATTNNANQQVATVYRTTDTGRTWHPVTLP